MFSKSFLKVSIAACAVVAMGGTAFASGFMVRDNSTSALITSFAGSGAYGYDPSHQIYNPATLTDLWGKQITGDLKGFLPSASIDAISATEPTGAGGASIIGLGDSGELTAAAIAPTGFASHRVNDRFVVGFGAYSPFASKLDGPSSWAGMYQIISNEMTSYNFQASAAFQVNDWISAGASLNTQYFAGHWRRFEYFGGTGIGFLKGDDVGLGFMAGLTITPHENTRIGISYRSAINHVLNGNAGIEGIGAEGAKTSLTTPDTVTVSLKHKMTDKLTFLADVGWTGWSKFTGLSIDLAVNPDQVRPQDWRDTWHAAIGARLALSDTLTIGGGILFDQKAPNTTANSLSPDGDRIQISVGLEKKLSKKMRMSLAISHQMIGDAGISIVETVPPRAGTSFTGTMSSHVTTAGASVTVEW